MSHHLGDNTSDNLTLPGTGSQRATDTLSKSFPDQANGSSPIVLHVTSGKLTDSKYSSAVNQAAADVAKAPDVASVVNPLTSQGASALSKDQATGYLSVTMSVRPGALSVEDAQTIINAAAKPAQAAGIQVQTGGQLGQKVSKPSTESSELIGIIAAMVILTFTFGTVVAMLLPILTAILGLASTLSIIRMLSHVTTVSTVAPTLATMIGLGVGIDYALFIVTRHFRGLDDGLDLRESIARAVATSGRRRGVRRRDGDHRARVAGGGQHPAGDDDGPDGRDRGGRRGARRPDPAAGDCWRSPVRTSTRCGSAAATRTRIPGKKGMWARWAPGAPSGRGRAGRPGDPDPAGDPAAVAEPGAEGRRSAVAVDDRPPGV